MQIFIWHLIPLNFLEKLSGILKRQFKVVARLPAGSSDFQSTAVFAMRTGENSQ